MSDETLFGGGENETPDQSATPATHESSVITPAVTTPGAGGEDDVDLLAGKGASGEKIDEKPIDEEQFEDWEHKGKTYKIPAALKPALLRQSEFARRAEEITQQKAALESERATHQNVSAEYMREIGKVMAMDEKIQAYNEVDWNAWAAQDPVQAQAGFFELTRLKDSRQQLANQILQKETQRQQTSRQQAKQHLATARENLLTRIPTWGPETEKAISDFAISEYELRIEEIARIADPRVVHGMYKHMSAVAELAAVKKELAKLKTPVPEKKLSGGVSPGAKSNPVDMDVDEFSRYRRRIINKRGR